jgi:hypothetical protein
MISKSVPPYFFSATSSILNGPVVHIQNISRSRGVSVGGKDEPFLDYFYQRQGQQQFDQGPTSIIDPQSMTSAHIPNRANAASTGLDAHPFVQRGGVLIEQGILVSTCVRVTLRSNALSKFILFPLH